MSKTKIKAVYVSEVVDHLLDYNYIKPLALAFAREYRDARCVNLEEALITLSVLFDETKLVKFTKAIDLRKSLEVHGLVLDAYEMASEFFVTSKSESLLLAFSRECSFKGWKYKDTYEGFEIALQPEKCSLRLSRYDKSMELLRAHYPGIFELPQQWDEAIEYAASPNVRCNPSREPKQAKYVVDFDKETVSQSFSSIVV
jgi:hypothetical protein